MLHTAFLRLRNSSVTKASTQHGTNHDGDRRRRRHSDIGGSAGHGVSRRTRYEPCQPFHVPRGIHTSDHERAGCATDTDRFDVTQRREQDDTGVHPESEKGTRAGVSRLVFLRAPATEAATQAIGSLGFKSPVVMMRAKTAGASDRAFNYRLLEKLLASY